MAAKEKELTPEERHRKAMDLLKAIAPARRKPPESGHVRAEFHYDAKGDLSLVIFGSEGRI